MTKRRNMRVCLSVHACELKYDIIATIQVKCIYYEQVFQLINTKLHTKYIRKRIWR
jgi:hypothetical protein